MNKKLGRALNGDFWVLILILGIFTVLSAVFGQYVLALVELGITAISFAAYMLYRSYRKKELQDFVQKYTDHYAGTSGAASPFPTALIRLFDGGIVYADRAFVQVTGLSDSLKTRMIGQVLPARPHTVWVVHCVLH